MIDKCAACGLKDAPHYDENGLCPLCSPEFVAPKPQMGIREKQNAGVTARDILDTGYLPQLIAERAEGEISRFGGVRKAAVGLTKELGHRVTPGVVSLARKGRDIPSTRRAMGLPLASVEVRPCPECGELHEQKATCPRELQRARKRPRRHRLHYECGRGAPGRERADELRAEMQALGIANFTRFVNILLLERKLRLGICPDCGNDECMADGVTGLWCPACDASYLLERRDFYD